MARRKLQFSAQNDFSYAVPGLGRLRLLRSFDCGELLVGIHKNRHNSVNCLKSNINLSHAEMISWGNSKSKNVKDIISKEFRENGASFNKSHSNTEQVAVRKPQHKKTALESKTMSIFLTLPCRAN